MELTSTEKAARYRETYVKSVLGAPRPLPGFLCVHLGLEDRGHGYLVWHAAAGPSRLAAVDAMQELWTGKQPAHPCPIIESLALAGSDQVSPGEAVQAVVKAGDQNRRAAKIEWILYHEQGNYGVQGTGAAATPSYPEAIAQTASRR